MNIDKFKYWLNKFKKAWENIDPKSAADLFSKDVEYYESALKAPCKNWAEVSDLWKIISTNQKNVIFNFNILAVSENLGVVNWQVERIQLPQNTKQKIDGIFVLRLNEDELCNYFKQWRTVE